MAALGGGSCSNVTITFGAGTLHSGRDLAEIIEAMGVHIHSASITGLPSEPVAPPFAAYVGDTSQPGLQITWALLPEAKCTAQLNYKARTLAFKGKRGVVDPRSGLFVLFFGPPLTMKAAAQAAKAKAMPQAPADIRAMLLKSL